MIPRRLNKRLVFFLAAIAVLLAVGGTWLINSRGGIVNLLHLPPVRDSSTPATQNVFTLAEVYLPEHNDSSYSNYSYQTLSEYMTPGICGIWIKTPPTPTEISQNHMTTPVESGDFGPGGKVFSVTAQTSLGDALALPWKMTEAPPDYNRADHTITPGDSYILAVVPAGYPNACRYIDVTVSDNKGHTARWRITRLPRMKQILPPPVVVQNVITTHGITVTADARRDGIGSVEYRFRPVLPPNSHQWDINFTGSWLEYEPYGYQTGPNEISHSHPIKARNGMFTDDFEKYNKGISSELVQAPYRSSSRFIRFTCQLRQFETHDETVTFHDVDIAHGPNWPKSLPASEEAYCFNVTRPQTVTTPSGVQVTLPAQGKPPQMLGGGINIVFEVQPSQPLNSLPHSPLFQAYHKAVSLDYQFPSPFRVSSWQFDPGPLHHYLAQYDKYPYPSVYPTRLKDFSIIIRQRVDLQTIPMTFTVPVKDPTPKAHSSPNQP